MSSGNQQHLTPADIKMLERVLKRAALADFPESELRSEAARFLIARFQHGITDESALYHALVNRPDARTSAPDASSDSALTADPAIRRSTPVTRDGFRFGRRVESNGTWTIYHVFSGQPAKYGAWNMIGLNIKIATRVLKILNAPQKAA